MGIGSHTTTVQNTQKQNHLVRPQESGLKAWEHMVYCLEYCYVLDPKYNSEQVSSKIISLLHYFNHSVHRITLCYSAVYKKILG